MIQTVTDKLTATGKDADGNTKSETGSFNWLRFGVIGEGDKQEINGPAGRLDVLDFLKIGNGPAFNSTDEVLQHMTSLAKPEDIASFVGAVNLGLSLTGTLSEEQKTQASRMTDWINRGSNLWHRSGPYQAMLRRIAGPEKSFNKQVEQFMADRLALGKPVTEDVARKVIKRRMEDEDRLTAEIMAAEETAKQDAAQASQAAAPTA